MKKFLLFLMPAVLFACKNTNTAATMPSSIAPKPGEKIIVSYVIGWDNPERFPDPALVTHINYAFGHVNKTFNGIEINNTEKLRKVVALKKENKDLKVMLSIGGWTSGNFSEMAAEKETREAFAEDCARVIREFGLDGVDIDWEYPTSSEAGISSSPDDKENYTLLMRDIRKAIGRDKLLTLASDKSAGYIDFPAILPYIDFVNIMTYDMGGIQVPIHHSAMYRSDMVGKWSCEESIQAHVDAGIPIGRLVFGMPFYGHGIGDIPYYVNYIDIPKYELEEKWDDVAKGPYAVNGEGEPVLHFDNPRSMTIKCRYLLDKGMLGAMYWDYSGDDENGTLSKALFNGVFPDKAVK